MSRLQRLASQFRAADSVVCRCVLILLLVGAASSCNREPDNTASGDPPAELANAAEVAAQVEHFCGNCHALPSPESFPRHAWDREVSRGYEFYNLSGRDDLEVPRRADVVQWFRERAPEEFLVQQSASSSGTLDFRPEPFDFAQPLPVPGTAGLRLIPGEAQPSVFLLDMLNGTIGSLSVDSDKRRLSKLLSSGNPCRIEPSDLDVDGVPDYLVADLGSGQPEDHNRGRILWLRDVDGSLTETVLASDLGRVADVRPADFDGDGDDDLIVAEFGWLDTGRILLFENLTDGAEGSEGQLPEWKRHVIDPRHGTIHVPVVDLNGDGLLDFVALVSQEYEAVDAFLNQGGLKFEQVQLWAAPDPSYGSSGIEMVDLDQDGDMDVLYSNGDTMDSFYLKPYHGITWLENRGSFPFEPHELTRMPGVARALPADLDGDGDLDIAACSLIPWSQLQDQPAVKLDSLVWLENTGECNFERHVLEQSRHGHLTMETGDIDSDGDIDLVVGGFGAEETDTTAPVTVWWNEASPES